MSFFDIWKWLESGREFEASKFLSIILYIALSHMFNDHILGCYVKDNCFQRKFFFKR